MDGKRTRRTSLNPMIEPVEAPISQEWNLTAFARDNPQIYGPMGHRGRDYAAFDGTDVRAPEAGTITFVGTKSARWSWGYYVEVRSGVRTHFFCHLQTGSAMASPGDGVAEGGLLAKSDSTPNWPPHLHWEVRGGGPPSMNLAVDPRTLLHPERYTAWELRAYGKAAAARAEIDSRIFTRQITQESGWNMYALSPAGAVGIAQIVPRWHPVVNPWDPYAALDYAANLMRRHLREFGSYELALAAYNAGSNAVSHYGGVPPFPETRMYVRAILGGETNVTESVFDDPDFWLKSKWEELAQQAIQVVNRAKGGMTPTDDESFLLNHRYKELVEDWPKLMAAERHRAGATG